MNFSLSHSRAFLSAFFLILLFLFPLRLDAENDLDAANRAYTAGNYDESARLFRQTIEVNGYSAALCFDLANAEAKAGHPGAAMLNYERARYLAPAAADIDHNLQLARKQAGLAPNSYRWWQIALRTIDWTWWLAIMGVLLALIFLAIIGTAYASRLVVALKVSPRLLRNLFRTILFVAIPVCLLMGYVELSVVGFNSRIEAVVVVPKEAILRLSPFETSENIGTVPEGELVTVEQRHDDYLRVEGRDHHFGWLRRDSLEPVIPGSLDDKSSK